MEIWGWQTDPVSNLDEWGIVLVVVSRELKTKRKTKSALLRAVGVAQPGECLPAINEALCPIPNNSITGSEGRTLRRGLQEDQKPRSSGPTRV